MFTHFSNSLIETSARLLTALLIALLSVMGGPAAAIVYAAEEGAQEPPQEEPAQEAASEDDSSDDEVTVAADAEDGTEGEDGTEATDGDDTDTTDSGSEAGSEEDETDVPQGDGEASVETGDVEIVVDVGNGSNSNTTDTTNDGSDSDSTDSEEDDSASTTASTTVSVDTEIVADNDATTTNALVLDGNSGANTASAGGGASVDTGNVLASANVVNVVNTNIVNSTGLLYFLNLLFGDSALDLRDLFTVFSDEEGTGDPRCSFEACDENDIDFSSQADNVAAVDNDVVVRAQSGENAAAANTGDATVSTGNAYASANVVNVVNTNIVDANYLLLSVNNFGSFAKDIVFPGADFFKDIFSSSGALFGAGATASIDNDNVAGIQNTVNGEANTGDNEASSEGGSAAIATGNGAVAASVTNIANQNFLGDSLTFLFRVHGDWSGEIFGLPEGLTWAETEEGIAITLDPGAALGGGTTALAGAGDTYAVANTNSAQVTNNVSVFALTGDNKASSFTGNALVDTGDAYAAANILNIANTNVVGRNWTYAIFNIFGDWDGNITFGQPDLWVGARAEVPYDLDAGSCFAYEVTVNNFGDADARHVVLNTAFDRAFQQFSGFKKDLDDYLEWNVGTVLAGGSKTISLPVCLSNIAGGGLTLTTDFEVESGQDDFNEDDNYDQISVVTERRGSTGSNALRLGNAAIEIEKSASVEEAIASSTVTYTIVIRNSGDPVYHALLIDTIEDEDGNVIHEQRWGLDTVWPDEEITISYDVFYSASTTPGDYTNYAFLSGVEKHPNFEQNYGNMIDSPIAASVVEIRALPKPAIETVTAKYCEPYLTEYIRFGGVNSQSEVEKLQAFLIEFENAQNINITGFYDATTYQAVHDFQTKYASDVLTPWGAEQSTGFVYYTTQKKINDIYCGGERDFPLSADQLEEIEDYRERIRTYEAADVEVPEPVLREIGRADDTPSSGDSTELATAEPRPATREDETNTQTAAAATALSEEDAAGLYEALRSRLESFFGWLSFGEEKEGKEVTVR